VQAAGKTGPKNHDPLVGVGSLHDGAHIAGASRRSSSTPQEPIMKYLLIPLALVAGSAFACPGAEGSKDAMASPSSDKAVVAKKATTKQVAAVKAEKKVATKTASASPKVAGL
jgi:hypothetical protein